MNNYIALYTRTSTHYQATGIEAQRRTLEQYCKERGIRNYQVFEDKGVSGAKSSRPSLDRMMAEVRKGRIESVIVYSFSRFARSTQHLLAALQEFSGLKVTFISISEQLETESAIGKALFTIIGAIAELERELVSERVKCGLANAKAKGKRLGAPKKRNSKLIRELANQRLSYRKIAELTGNSIATISRELRIVS